MSKKVFIFVAAMLLITSVTMANTVLPLAGSVTQMQSFNIGDALNNGMASVVALTHGDTGGSVIQSMNVANTQSSPCVANPCFNLGCFNSCGVDAVETQVASLDQTASAMGECGIINVQTYLDAGGLQNQFIGFSTSTKYQDQSLGLAAQQVLTRGDGSGGGMAANDAFLSQTQAGANAGGSVFESSTIDACQVSNAGGAANSTAALASTMVAATSQLQQVQ
ncbi:MAG: hypothetical protein JXA96_18065 [Sedimentisphaerales bacterium]|nr:hypothetical protein [Sedimentisphaerales bacterium]